MDIAATINPVVLLVEDSDMQAKLYSALLRHNGFDVLEARDGNEAMARLRDATPDMIVLDMVLPDTDGHELCMTIRRFPQWASLPIMMLTCHDETELKVKAFDGGVDDYCSKTVHAQELVARLQRLLRRKVLHEKLTESEKLETLHRAASTLAHGINNPLAVLSMGIEMLTEEFPEQSPHRTILSRMDHHLGRIKQLVSRLQKMTKLVEAAGLSDFDILEVDDETAPQAAKPRIRRGVYQVMIVDDDPDIRMLIRESLERTGRFTVVGAENGPAGLEAARRSAPDLFLLDILLPIADGYEVLGQIKKDPALSYIPVVMLSVNSNVRDMVRAFELGAANYLVKPVEPLRLAEHLFRTLEREGR
ncbi:MAG: response regulator [Candidatus Wallbacteria bacterium]|nr:response regulator [Candidatus Wallbacteria bacterium]